MPHLAAAKQATGEAVYCDDMPKYAGKSSWKKKSWESYSVRFYKRTAHRSVAAVLGAVHTWCSGTSAWVLAQSGVVFTL